MLSGRVTTTIGQQGNEMVKMRIAFLKDSAIKETKEKFQEIRK